MPRPALDAVTGALLVALTVLVTVSEWTGHPAATMAAHWLVAPIALILMVQVRWSRRIFVILAAALIAVAAATRADWAGMVDAGLGKAAFIGAFFTALATLRNASGTSAVIATCGRFLAQQPPGRRYAALTVGGQLFGLLLNYGALVLLGSLAETNARLEPNAEIRAHRLRRMLLAIQRGFVSTLPWSPLAFAMAIATSLVPGARWADAVGPCLVSGALLALLGWGLDTAFKPRLSAPAPARGPIAGSWLSLWPLLALLAVLGVLVGGLELATGLRIVAIVMLVVPLMSLLWIGVQTRGDRAAARIAARARDYAVRDLPQYRSEIVLLMMAGLIGTLGAGLLVPVVAGMGLDLGAAPAWMVLVGIVWLIPIAGQLGMNPILSVSLLAPMLPEAAALGLTPADFIVAITAGWALSGASSPYTATTMMIGSLGGVSALRVGLGWNGLYTVLAAALLSVWVVAAASL